MSHISIIRKSFCLFIIPALLMLLLIGCGGGSDDGFLIPPQVSEEEILEGIFVDSPVSGLTYYTASGSGTTDIYGKFIYEKTDKTITFSIAGIVLGRCTPKEVLTPVDLVDGAVDETDPAVTNICRLLLFLDSDGNPDNGITIPDEINDLLAGSGILSGGIDFSDADFDTNTNVKILINTMNAGNVFAEDHPLTLCTPDFAQSHLAETLSLYGLVDLEPSASIVSPAENITITTGGSVYFQGAASGGNPSLTYEWYFGDGKTSNVLTPGEITFSAAGEYTVTFYVTDGDGDISSATVVVTVTDSSGITVFMHHVIFQYDGYICTFYYVRFPEDFPVAYPDGIESVTITNPDNDTVCTLAQMKADPYGRGLYALIPGAPMYGVHTFTIGAGGQTYTLTDTHETNLDLPVPDNTAFIPNGFIDTLTPELLWDTVPNIDLYYNIRILDEDLNTLHTSGFYQDMSSYTIPEGVLSWNQIVYWRVEVFDAENFDDSNNAAWSNYAMIMPGNGIYAGLFQDIMHDGSIHTTYGVYFSEYFPAAFPAEIESITITHESGDVVCTLEDDMIFDTYASRGFYARIPGAPMLGEYTFTIVANGQEYTCTDTQTTNLDLPIADSTTFTPTGSIYSLTPYMQWDLVSYPDTELFYRVKIYDEDENGKLMMNPVLNLSSFVVPEGTLSWNEDYNWRIEVYDADNWIDANNRSRSDLVMITTGDGIRAGICQEIYYTGERYTLYYIYFSGDLPATFPDNIESVTITHEGADVVCTLEDMGIDTYNSRGLWARIPGAPMLGEYTFTIVADGRTYTLTDTQTINRDDLSALDSATLSPSGCIDTLTPQLQCTPVAYSSDLYYQANIFDEDWHQVMRTAMGLNASTYTVPKGILSWNEDSYWRVDIYDAGNLFDANNRAISDYMTITPGDGVNAWLCHFSYLNNDSAQFFIEFTDCSNLTGPEDLISITITDPDENPILTLDDMSVSSLSLDTVLFAGYMEGEPLLGEYIFEIITTGGNYIKTYTHSINRDLPAPESDTFSPEVGDVINTTTPVLSWRPVEFSENTINYNVWIFEYSGNLIWTSDESENTFVQVPDGILERGQQYQWYVFAGDDDDNLTYNLLPGIFFISNENIVEITSPSPEISIYAGGTVNFQASVTSDPASYTYSWIFGNGQSSSVQNPGDITFDSTGVYTVELSASSGGYTYTDTVTVKVFNPGDIAIAHEHILEFVQDPTDESLARFMADLPLLNNSEEADLYRAIAEIAGVTNSPVIIDIIGRLETYLGIDIGLNTDYKAWEYQYSEEGFNALLKQVAYDYLHDYSYNSDLQAILAELSYSLGQADYLLDLAEGIDTCLTSTENGTVCIDTIDIHVLRGIVKIAEALVIYLQSIDVELVDWAITDPDNPEATMDIREFILEMPDSELWSEEQEQQWEQSWREFAERNPEVASYTDRTMLANFRTEFEAGIDLYSLAVNDLDALGEDGRQARINHVCNLDTQFQMEMALAINDEFIPSVLDCLDYYDEDIIAIYPEEDKWYPIDGGDGHYYLQETYDIYQHIGTHNPEFEMTAYGLLSPDGDKTPRDVISDISNLPVDEDGHRELYQVYNFDEATKSVYMTIIGETDDYPIDSFEVPNASLYGYSGITIYDNSITDWEDVPVFETINDITIKLAVDEFNDSFYILAQKDPSIPLGVDWWYWGSSIIISSAIPVEPVFEFYYEPNEYAWLVGDDELYNFSLSANMSSYDTEPSFNVHGFYLSEENDEILIQIPYDYRFVTGTEFNSVEIRIDDSAYLLMREGSCQQINMSEYIDYEYNYEYYYDNYYSNKIYKLLPEITD